MNKIPVATDSTKNAAFCQRHFVFKEFGAKSTGGIMSKDNFTNHRQIILEGVETAIAQALERFQVISRNDHPHFLFQKSSHEWEY